MPLGALIAGGASLISGLFGRSSAKKQAKKEEAAIRAANEVAVRQADDMNRSARLRAEAAALVPVQSERENATTSVSQGGVDMAGFMAAAENYGFNPLTFLRSGALSLFARTESATHSVDWECTTGERAMDAAQAGQYIPQLSPVISQTKVPGMGEVFGNALNTGVNQYLGDAQRQQDFQNDMMLAQLRGANRYAGAPLSRSFYGPAAFSSGGKVSGQSEPPLSFGARIGPVPMGYFGAPASLVNSAIPLYQHAYDDTTGEFVRVAGPDVPDFETSAGADVMSANARYKRAGSLMNERINDFFFGTSGSNTQTWIDSNGNVVTTTRSGNRPSYGP